MTDEFYSLVTDIGTEKQIESIRDGLPFDVYDIALGDSFGQYYEPDLTQTRLVNEVWRGNIEKCEWENNKFYCITTVPSTVGGFTVREAGVFDSNNNLLVISKFPETIKQTPATGTVKQLTIRIEVELSNSELANLIVNPNITLVSKDEFNTKLRLYQKLSEKGQPQGYVPLDSNTKIPVEFIPDLQSILTPFCLNSCRLDEKGNPNLLSVQGNIITAHSPFTYTTAKNKTYKVDNDLSLDVTDLLPEAGQTKNFNLFVTEEDDNFSLIAIPDTIFTQMIEPVNPQTNDVWFKVIEPLAGYIRISGEWQDTNIVPIGSFILSA